MMAERGIRLVGRYLWRDRYESGATNKGINRGELDALREAGIDVFFIYEEDGKELTGGFDAGVRVAKRAQEFLSALGADVANKPIYFNVDFDADASLMPAILDALRGVASVIGLDRTGLYSGFDPMKAAFDAGAIKWGFQTYAWSDDEDKPGFQPEWDPRAQLQQWSNGQWGGSIDFTRAMTEEFGQ